MLAVPILTVGLALFLVSVAWRSNRASRVPPPRETPLVVEEAGTTFLGCVDCHGDLDKVFKEGRLPDLIFTHAKHFAKGVSECSVCHPANTHEPDRINKPTMSRCFTCHGLERSSIAPGACQFCHPPGMPQVPSGHFTESWLPSEHAKEASVDRFECLTCHKQTFCDSCHGLEMPHPEGWANGPHAVTYFDDPALCASCHPQPQDERDFCDTCHHRPGPNDVAWVEFHPTAVMDLGAGTCFQCHSDQTCRTCHTKGREDISADEALLVAASSPEPTVSSTPTPGG
jgi:hypothetical protein